LPELHAEAAAEGQLSGADWPCWRGPAGNNISDSNPPIEWSPTKNILWKVAVPGRGHASPCVFGDKIILASADDSSETQFLLCYDRARGELLWRVDLHHRTLPPAHQNNSHASATPACDGKAVYTVFASGGELTVSSVSMEGKILWQKDVGKYQHANGYGASPVLFDRIVIVANDNQLEPSIVALDRADGHVKWRTTRPKSDNSATPIVGVVGGRAQLLINGARLAASYDPATGEEFWRVTHGTEVAACTMGFDKQNVFASGNVPEKNLLCVRADGHGDVSDTHVLWKTNQLITYVPSPLAFDRYLFAVTDSGLAWCRDAATGDVIWKERLAGTFFSSPVLAAKKIFATNDLGVTYVFRAAPQLERLAENDIEEACMATPAICHDRIYLRSAAHLFCIGVEEQK
jgi:outer membrane protein assembly factor BamB